MPITKEQRVSIKNVDLSVYPEAKADLSSQITIGDLHGNALKFIYFLIREGVLALSKENYDAFVEIYNASRTTAANRNNSPLPSPSKEQLNRFKDILAQAKIQPAATGKEIVVRLIGDELADRGGNDYFTLKIFEKLKQGGVRVEALFSNHGVEFIEAMESKTLATANPKLTRNGQMNSFKALQDLIKNNLITEAEVRKLYEENYQLFFKALSYTLKSNEITIYTHAPVGLDVIEQVAKKLKTPYNDSTPDKLADTIDKINEAFQKHVASDTVRNLYDNAKKNKDITPSEDPFALLMWHRPIREDGAQKYQPQRAPKHKQYNINYVHGHDSYSDERKNVVNLDNNLGKFESTGTYSVLKATGTTHTLVATAEKDKGKGKAEHEKREKEKEEKEKAEREKREKEKEEKEKAERENEEKNKEKGKESPVITLQSTHTPRGDPIYNKPTSTLENEWFNAPNKTQTYCLVANNDSNSIAFKTQELQNTLNDSIALTKASTQAAGIPIPPQLALNQTRLSHHQLYEDSSSRSTITQFGLIEKSLDKGSISSRLLLPSSVCLTKSDAGVNLDEFARLLMIIDQQVKQGISACGETATSEINLTLPIKNAAQLNLYEMAYLYYCQEKSYSCSCIDRNTKKPIETPPFPSDPLQSLSSLNKGKIDDLSEKQEKFKNTEPDIAAFTIHPI